MLTFFFGSKKLNFKRTTKYSNNSLLVAPIGRTNRETSLIILFFSLTHADVVGRAAVL
jgi:hypothetical protein